MEQLKSKLTFRTKLEAEVVGLYEVKGPKEGAPKHYMVLYNVRNQEQSVWYDVAFLQIYHPEEVSDITSGSIVSFAARVEDPNRRAVPVLGRPRGIKAIGKRSFGKKRQLASLHSLFA